MRSPIARANKKSFFLISIVVLFGIYLIAYSWPFFTGDFAGYMQSYDFGKKYKELYKWLSDDEQDYHILWLPAPYPTLYRGNKQAGYDPMAYFSGKPSLYFGKYTGPQFIIFLMKNFYEGRTKHLSNLLGLANVKYIIFDNEKRTTSTDLYYVNDYFPEMRFSNDKILTTLSEQDGLDINKTVDSISVYQNRDFLPHIFPVDHVGLIASDLGSLVSISYMKGIVSGYPGLIFTDQLSPEKISDLVSRHDTEIIIQDSRYLDLVLGLVPQRYTINPENYYVAKDPYKGWAPFTWFWYRWNYQSILEKLTFSMIPSSLDIPFSIDSGGEYEAYLRTYFSPDASNITVLLDKNRKLNVVTKTEGKEGFRWIKIPAYLDAGKHVLTLRSEEGENTIGKLIIAPKKIMVEALAKTRSLLKEKKLILISEMENAEYSPEGVWGPVKIGINASQGYALSTFYSTTIPLRCKLYIPRTGSYKLYVRAAGTIMPSMLKIKAGKRIYETKLKPFNEGFKWHEISSIFLSEGFNDIIFQSEGKNRIFLDMMVLKASDIPEERSLPVKISYKKVNPTKYLISASASAPFCLNLSERYNDSWRLHVGGAEFTSLPSYSFGNIFCVNRKGKLDMTLSFERQRYVKIGYIISGVAFIILIFIILIPDRACRYLKKNR